MKNILVREVMIPVSDYVTIKEENTLFEIFQILEKHKEETANHAHRDAIVINNDGNFIGKVTMIDVFRALEPNYKRLIKNYTASTLTKEYVIEAVKDFNLWLEPMSDLCKRGRGIKVSEIMYVPGKHEFIQEDESLEKALHEYVMDIHQPLIVKKKDKVTGILRFGDLYEVIRKRLLSCEL